MKEYLGFSVVLMTMMMGVKGIAQEFYFRAGGGYGVESGKTEYNNADPNGLTMIQQSTEITVSADGATASVKALNGTLGGGFKFNITGGYMFNPYIGAELGINYFSGDKKTIGSFTSPQLISSEEAYIQGVDLMPAVYLTPNFKKLNPYARLGLLVPVSGNLKIDTEVRQVNGGGQGTDILVDAQSEVKSRFSVGVATAIGLMYPIGDKLSLFGEVEFKSLSVKSKSAEIKSYTTTAFNNGQSELVQGQQLADLPISEKKFEFEKNFIQSTTAPQQPENQPRKIPLQFVNASGTNFNFGVRYVL